MRNFTLFGLEEDTGSGTGTRLVEGFRGFLLLRAVPPPRAGLSFLEGRDFGDGNPGSFHSAELKSSRHTIWEYGMSVNCSAADGF